MSAGTWEVVRKRRTPYAGPACCQPLGECGRASLWHTHQPHYPPPHRLTDCPSASALGPEPGNRLCNRHWAGERSIQTGRWESWGRRKWIGASTTQWKVQVNLQSKFIRHDPGWMSTQRNMHTCTVSLTCLTPSLCPRGLRSHSRACTHLDRCSMSEGKGFPPRIWECWTNIYSSLDWQSHSDILRSWAFFSPSNSFSAPDCGLKSTD